MSHETGTEKHFAESMAKLIKAIPSTVVKKALQVTNNFDKRRRLLPKEDIVYFVVFMAFCAGKGYDEVFRIFGEAQRQLKGMRHRVHIPANSSITEARVRLGLSTMESLSRDILGPIAVRRQTKGAFFKRWRITAIDGIVQNVEDTPANAKYFPRSRSQHGIGAYPQLRCVALVECGTRTIFDFELTKGKDRSEQALAEKLLPRVGPDDLLLADRLYCDGRKWRLATERGARAIFRAKADTRLPELKKLEDGSYMSTLAEGDRRRSSSKLHPVRVVEFRIQRRKKSELVRLITNLTPAEATNRQIIDLYRQRWEWEKTGAELKTVLSNNVKVLRSKTPQLVKQEFIGMILAHFTVKCFMHEAAIKAKIDMDRMSFKHSRNVVARRLAHAGASSSKEVLIAMARELMEVKNRAPDGRSNPRVLKSNPRKYETLPRHARRKNMFSKRQAKIKVAIVKTRHGRGLDA